MNVHYRTTVFRLSCKIFSWTIFDLIQHTAEGFPLFAMDKLCFFITSRGLTVMLRAESSQAISISACRSSLAARFWAARNRMIPRTTKTTMNPTQTTATKVETLPVKQRKFVTQHWQWWANYNYLTGIPGNRGAMAEEGVSQIWSASEVVYFQGIPTPNSWPKNFGPPTPLGGDRIFQSFVTP